MNDYEKVLVASVVLSLLNFQNNQEICRIHSRTGTHPCFFLFVFRHFFLFPFQKKDSCIHPVVEHGSFSLHFFSMSLHASDGFRQETSFEFSFPTGL